MRRLEIAVVANNIRRRDGEGHVMLEISRGLLQKGHAVTAFSTTCASDLLENERFHWKRVKGLPGPDMIAHFTFALASTRALSSRRFDAVCTMGPCGFSRDPTIVYAAFTQRGWQASWASNKPDLYRRAHSASARLLETRAIRRAAGVLAISESVAAELEQIVPEGAVVQIVPGGVDLDTFGPQTGADPGLTRSKIGLASDAFVVALIGEFATGRKGLARLLAALALSTDYKEVLLVHGSGPVESVRARAGQMGISKERLVFAPPQMPVVDVMRAVDVVAIPSTYEPFSLVALEAGVCEKAMILSDRAGVAPFLSADNAALVVDPSDTGGIRAAIDKLKHDAALREELAKRAGKVAAAFQWEAVGERASAVIEEIAFSSSRER